MSIFARRTLQRFLDSLSGTLKDRQFKKLVKDLDAGDPQSSLAAEWEVAILYALNRNGTVLHEADFGGSSRVDLHFREPNTAAEFLADVTCLSDRGREDLNPVDRLMELVRESATRLGINLAGFHFRIGLDKQGTSPNEKVTLHLPPLHAVPDFVETRIAPELKAIASNPSARRTIALGNKANDIQISYDPAGRYVGIGYASYRSATIIDNNPLYHRLQDKAEQLGQSGYAGPKGIIVCDGGCEILTSTMYSWNAVPKEKIVTQFFHDHRWISFVVLLWVVSSPFVPGQLRHHAVTGQIAINPWADVPLPLPLNDILKQLSQHWPPAIQDAENARTELEAPCPPHNPFRSHNFGSAHTMSEHMFRFSARELLELLAGRRSHAQFEQGHAFTASASEPAHSPNLFEQALEKGLTIKAVKIDHLPDRDDDCIEILLEGPDPAISKFRKPPARKPA